MLTEHASGMRQTNTGRYVAKNTGYQCPCCQREKKNNKYTNNSDSDEEIHQPLRTNKQNSIIIETGSEDENDNEWATARDNTTNNKTQQTQTKVDIVKPQEALKSDRKCFNVESDSEKDNASKIDARNAHPKPRDKTKAHTNILDSDGGIQQPLKTNKQNSTIIEEEEEEENNNEWATTPDNTIDNKPQQKQATVVCALGDGHYLRRSLGKIENTSPGKVVRKTKTYCENVLNTQATLYIYMDRRSTADWPTHQTTG